CGSPGWRPSTSTEITPAPIVFASWYRTHDVAVSTRRPRWPMNVVEPDRAPSVSPWMSGSYSWPPRLKPTSFVRNRAVVDQGDDSAPCVTRARQYIRVAGWRSTAGVNVVVPPAPSAIPACDTLAIRPGA